MGLERFIEAQDSVYSLALNEIKNGRKCSHWIWYIFPQLKGMGRSYNSEYYGISGISEAKDYLKHPVLGMRLREITAELLKHQDKSPVALMGSRIDSVKLCSCMTLFDCVSPNDVFNQVLKYFYAGERDLTTLKMIENNNQQ